MLPSVSVIIPTLDEAAHLPQALASVERGPGVEVIVVDGGSTDGTVQLARQQGADRVIQSQRSRARQMNAGAAAAQGQVLQFLHADTRLEPGAMGALRRAMLDPRVVGGAMRLRIDSPLRRVRWVAPAVNLRTRWLKLPYGDQAIFIRRSVFEALGGFADLPILEDYDLICRMRHVGQLVLLRSAAITSGRRWEANGLVRTTLANGLAVLLYRLGLPPQRVCACHQRMAPAPQRHAAKNEPTSAAPPGSKALGDAKR